MNNDFSGVGTVFNNYATFRKSAGINSSQTLIGSGVLFNQISGVADVQKGNLVLQGSGNFTGGAVNGPGITYLSIGNFNINGTVTPGPNNFVENSGLLVGNNVINGGLTWVAGNWDNAAVTIGAGSTVVVAGGVGNNDFNNCNLTNNGTVAWASGTLRGGGFPGTFIYNNGLWDFLRRCGRRGHLDGKRKQHLLQCRERGRWHEQSERRAATGQRRVGGDGSLESLHRRGSRCVHGK